MITHLTLTPVVLLLDVIITLCCVLLKVTDLERTVRVRMSEDDAMLAILDRNPIIAGIRQRPNASLLLD